MAAHPASSDCDEGEQQAQQEPATENERGRRLARTAKGVTRAESNGEDARDGAARQHEAADPAMSRVVAVVNQSAQTEGRGSRDRG